MARFNPSLRSLVTAYTPDADLRQAMKGYWLLVAFFGTLTALIVNLVML